MEDYKFRIVKVEFLMPDLDTVAKKILLFLNRVLLALAHNILTKLECTVLKHIGKTIMFFL
jgi:hypothetical protein